MLTSKLRTTLRVVVLEERVTPVAGQLDPTFGVGGLTTTRFPNPSEDWGASTAIDSLGRIVVAGQTYNGSNYDFGVARYTSAGALDTTFGGTGVVTFDFGGSDDGAYGVAVDSLDRVVVAGFTGSEFAREFAVARLTVAGALDSSFAGDGKQTIAFAGNDDSGRSVAVDSLNRVVVAGITNNGATDFAVARLTAAGDLDGSFDGDGRQTIGFGVGFHYAHGVAVDSLDRVVVAGYTSNGANSDFGVARLTAAGALDSSFDGDGRQIITFGVGNDFAYAVAVDSLNRVVIAGHTANEPSRIFAVARLTNSGALDNSFDGDGRQTIEFGAASDLAYGVAVDSQDRVVVAGYAFNGSNADFAVARLTAAGALDTSFDGDGKQTIGFGTSNDYANGVAVDSGNRIVVAGLTYDGSTSDFAMARLTVAGALDGSFDADGRLILNFALLSNAGGRSVAVDSLGRTVVAGYALSGASNVFAIARFTPAGAPDMSFGGNGIVTFPFGAIDDDAYDVAVDSLNRVVVAGSAFNGAIYEFAVARLTAAGALDPSFDADGKQTIEFGFVVDTVRGVAIDSLNRVVVAGYASNGLDFDFAVARLTTTGALDASFDGDGKQTVAFGALNDFGMSVAVDSLDRPVIAGYTDTGSNYDFAVARLTTAGALDGSFDGDGKQTIAFGASDDFALGVAIDSLNRIVVAGITHNGLNDDFAVARLTVAGALDGSFDGDGRQTLAFGASSDDEGNSVAVDSLDRILVAGRTDNGSTGDFAVARFTTAGALDAGFDGDGKQTIDFGGAEIAYGVAIAPADRVVLAGVSAGNEGVFAVARLTGDTTVAAAQVNDGSVQRSRVISLTVRFSGSVTFSGSPAQAFTLVRTSGGAVTFAANVSIEYGGTVVVLTNFTGPETEFGSLRDGRYTLTALANQISADGQALDGNGDGTPGGNYIFGDQQGLFRFYGDMNGDRHVDVADFGLFSSTFNLSTGQTGFLAAFDFNGDGHIDIADFGQFSVRFFTVLP